MRIHFGIQRLILVSGLLLSLVACQNHDALQITSESDEPQYRRGMQMLHSGQQQAALQAFLKVIEKRPEDAPDSNLEAGEIYLNHLKDPISAIYHFREYLKLRPNSPEAPMVRQSINTAKKQFALTIPGINTQVNQMDLMDVIDKLKKENAQLKSRLAQLEHNRPSSALSTTAPARSVSTSHPAPARQASGASATSGRRHYTVVQGDTLYKISQKVYGTGSRWKEIYEANKDIIANPSDMKIGTQLVIP